MPHGILFTALGGRFGTIGSDVRRNENRRSRGDPNRPAYSANTELAVRFADGRFCCGE
ncbi:MAG: hypothetical protein OXN17_11900 [Candidatus Poribacteria bacterium]|nr:hypothetical protein [Candidatus Poribacteria bacterium]